MPLSEIQKKQLNRLSVHKLLEYIDNGYVSYPSDFEFVDEVKKQQVEAEIANRPNPQEKADWNNLQPMMGSNSDAFRRQLEAYIQKWSHVNPSQNHIAEAQAEIDRIDRHFAAEQAAIEQSAWDSLNLVDISALISYLQKYPNTAHKDEIDESLWSLISNSFNIIDINSYLTYFPNGNHVRDAQAALSAYSDWQTVKYSNDIHRVFDYVQNHKDSPFINEAKMLLYRLKESAIDEMKRLGADFEAETLLEYLRTGIFTENELFQKGLVTPGSLGILRNFKDVKNSLPDIATEILACRNECAAGRTDVFLFGIPSTGKSCILMGLIGSSNMNVSFVKAGGPYAAALQQYLDAGCIIGQTPKDFIATLEADIRNGDQTHRVNLIEMAGEDFAFKLAKNPDRVISFKDMGTGAPEILRNDNRKAFFLIVDPTARVAKFKRETSSIDADGNVIRSTEWASVNQRITLKRMVDLFSLPENASIMEKVDSIHIIVTKADMCGDDTERDENAYKIFTQNYQSIIQPLVDICEKYGINVATGGYPKLYTFSLGNFYVGNIYQYDETDANKLIEVIKGNVSAEKKPTFWDKLKAIVNNPII